MPHRRRFAGRNFIGIFVLAFLLAGSSSAQNPAQDSAIERGVMVRQAQIYLAPSTDSAKLAQIDRGREVAVLDHGSKPWVHVLAILSEGSERDGFESPNKTVTGWMIDKGIVRASTANGDRILFGEASSSELEASRRNGRKGADKDALRLYYRTWEYFPKSEIAGEALFRAADIQWQLDRSEALARPSAREAKPINDSEGIEERMMKEVKKKFPGTKWAALADYDMIDNKLCGDWQAQSRCPQREAEVYENYAKEYPQSPRLQEALYQAARRRAALIQIYLTEGSKSKSEDSRQKALELSQRAVTVDPSSDWGMRAQALAYSVQQEIALLGNVIE
jgi:hypothetical protein